MCKIRILPKRVIIETDQGCCTCWESCILCLTLIGFNEIIIVSFFRFFGCCFFFYIHFGINILQMIAKFFSLLKHCSFKKELSIDITWCDHNWSSWYMIAFLRHHFTSKLKMGNKESRCGVCLWHGMTSHLDKKLHFLDWWQQVFKTGQEGYKEKWLLNFPNFRIILH